MLRGLTDDIDAWTANGFRYPLAAVLYWPILWSARRRGALNADVLRRCLVPAFFSFSGQVFWALSFYFLSASAVGFLVRNSIGWTIIAGMFVFREERAFLKSARFFCGLTVCVVGVLVLSLARGLPTMEITATGIVLILFCGMFFGLYAVSVRYFLWPVHSALAAAVVCNYVAIGTLLLLPLGEPAELAQLSGQNWLLVLLSAFLGIVLGHSFLYSAVNRLGTSITSSVQSVTPFVTVAFAYLYLGEALTGIQWIGGITIVVGAIVLLSIRRNGPGRAAA
jgi:drug/metabolite transporter (DMT)-like permease